MGAVRSVNQWANRHKPETYYFSRFAFLMSIAQSTRDEVLIGGQLTYVEDLFVWSIGIGGALGLQQR